MNLFQKTSEVLREERQLFLNYIELYFSILILKTLKIPILLFLSIFRGRTELGDVTVHNIKQLKRLNQVVFPVTYNDKFYKDVLEVGELAKLGNVQYYSYLYR